MTATPDAVYDHMGLDELAAEKCGRIVRRGDKYALYFEPRMSIEGALDLDAIDALQFVSRDEMRKYLTNHDGQAPCSYTYAEPRGQAAAGRPV